MASDTPASAGTIEVRVCTAFALRTKRVTGSSASAGYRFGSERQAGDQPLRARSRAAVPCDRASAAPPPGCAPSRRSSLPLRPTLTPRRHECPARGAGRSRVPAQPPASGSPRNQPRECPRRPRRRIPTDVARRYRAGRRATNAHARRPSRPRGGVMRSSNSRSRSLPMSSAGFAIWCAGSCRDPGAGRHRHPRGSSLFSPAARPALSTTSAHRRSARAPRKLAHH